MCPENFKPEVFLLIIGTPLYSIRVLNIWKYSLYGRNDQKSNTSCCWRKYAFEWEIHDSICAFRGSGILYFLHTISGVKYVGLEIPGCCLLQGWVLQCFCFLHNLLIMSICCFFWNISCTSTSHWPIFFFQKALLYMGAMHYYNGGRGMLIVSCSIGRESHSKKSRPHPLQLIFLFIKHLPPTDLNLFSCS